MKQIIQFENRQNSRDDHCNYRLTATVVTCTGSVQDCTCQQPALFVGGIMGSYPSLLNYWLLMDSVGGESLFSSVYSLVSLPHNIPWSFRQPSLNPVGQRQKDMGVEKKPVGWVGWHKRRWWVALSECIIYFCKIANEQVQLIRKKTSVLLVIWG